MAGIPIELVGPRGEPIGQLQADGLSVIAASEDVARARNLSKRTTLPLVLHEYLEAAGYEVDEDALAKAARALDALRRGQAVPAIRVLVRPPVERGPGEPTEYFPQDDNMSISTRMNRSQTLKFFEVEREYPDQAAREWYDRLVGLDVHKERLLVELEMLLFPERVESWSKQYHNGQILQLCRLQRNRVPLVLLEGDVGTGKTALAETIGDALARRVGDGARVLLLKINTQVRGTGQVGEMSDLIVQAFTHAEARASSASREPVLLLLDEADALAVRRDTQQMHHEDKAGLDTLLQRLDNLRLTRLRIAAMFVTNRPDALDPAVRRRAALALRFERPDDGVRAEILRSSVPELALEKEDLAELVRLTSPQDPKNQGIPFTASDLTDCLLAGALREAFVQRRALAVNDLLVQARKLKPTPPIGLS